MSKPKFKVGVKVRLKKSAKLGDCIGVFELFRNMYDTLQNPHTITSIKKHSNIQSLVAQVAGWYVPVEWLEHIKPEKIIIYRNGAEVVAKNTSTGKTGVAKCNPADEFDFNTGAKLAFERLINPEPEKPKYYTGKVVCVRSAYSDFTVGKIYKFDRGKTQDNEGDYRPSGYRLKELEDGCCFTSTHKFIPLIED